MTTAERGAGANGRTTVAIWMLRVGAVGSAVLGVLAVFSTLATSAPEVRVPMALVPAGLALFRILVAVGVWRLARWALWTGAVLSLLSLPLPLLLEVARVEFGVGFAETTSFSLLPLWGQVVTAVVFLAGLALLPRGRRSREASSPTSKQSKQKSEMSRADSHSRPPSSKKRGAYRVR